MENLSFNEMKEISGGDIIRVTDTNCEGEEQWYYYNTETGECWDILGSPKQSC